MNYTIGTSRQRIQITTRGIGMLGYGLVDNTADHILSDLYVRTLALKNNDQLLIFVNAEIGFITQAVQQAVISGLKTEHPELNEHQVMLTAQHTHSAPGGFSHYAFYNMTVPGFQPEVFDAIVSACVASISTALREMEPGSLSFGHLSFAPEDEVAFNRSLEAYNSNPENLPLSENETHLAIDRNMYLLKAANQQGKTLAVVNWFGVHGTSISSNNQGISSDNKGYAARLLEEYFLQTGQKTICIFAQAAAGDVSPCFYGKGKSWPRGKFANDIESCRFNGRLQFQQAKRILTEQKLTPLTGPLNADLIWADFSHIECNPAFTGGHTDCRTVAASHGVAFLQGTRIDGPGIAPALAKVIAQFTQAQQKRKLKQLQKKDPAAWQNAHIEAEMQAPKAIAIESGNKRFLGFNTPHQLPVPNWVDPVIGELKRQHKAGAMQEHSWTPQILPLQIFCLGHLALVSFPGEITTTAARRLSRTVAKTLNTLGIKEVVVSAYANTYFGYANTPEEYQLQTYEGGHNVFGRWTLPAFQTLYQKMAQELAKEYSDRKLDRSLRPPVFSTHELALRSANTEKSSP